MRNKILFCTILILGLALRLYYINFGLPHSFYADEPEFNEPAIRYTYELKNIIKNDDYYQLIPVSYVYGTVPVYFYTASLMVFSKNLNLLHIGFDKTTIFIFFRTLTALISLLVCVVAAFLAKKSFGRPNDSSYIKVFYLTLLLCALNWKLIVHAHYANADIFLTLFLLFSFYWAWLYVQTPNDKNLFLSAIFFGLAVGTKITALISLPLYFYLIAKKRDIYGFPGFILSAGISFIATNPFSIIFFRDFSFRVFNLLNKEGGMVFDSVDSNPFKYILALNLMVTLPVVAASFYGIYNKLKISREKTFDVFLIANIVVYLIFFSAQSRRVDRWLLPIIPIVLMYGAFGLQAFFAQIRKTVFKWLLVIGVFGIYIINPVLLLSEFQRWTPKSAAYIWANKNLPELSQKLVYTEEGLDPLNKLALANVYQFQVYGSDNAQFFYPQDPLKYDYVILSSRPMENFKRTEVVKKFPYYAKLWTDFENKVENPKYFTLIKDFTLSKPNLIPLSDVFIYKKL